MQTTSDSLDELDLKLIRELEQDARAPYLALASKLDISQPTVRRRLDRLIDRNIVTIACVPNYNALGYRARVSLAIKVLPGTVDEVAKKLAASDNIEFLCITTGSYDIIGFALYRTPEEFMKSFPGETGLISEDLRIETMLSVELVKNSWGPRQFDDVMSLNSNTTLTKLELSIIRELRKSPRASATMLAKEIGANLLSVRTSLNKLISERIVGVFSIPNPAAFGESVIGATLIQVHPAKLDSLTNMLKGHSSIKNVALTIGKFNCLIWTSFQNSDQLYNFLAQDLGHELGVVHYESLHVLRVPKGPFGATIKQI